MSSTTTDPPEYDDPPVYGAEELAALIESLSQSPERESIASELEVLRSIYDEGAIKLWAPVNDYPEMLLKRESNIRYEVELNLLHPHEDVSVRILVSLPSTYPVSSPPQLQILSRYVGAYGVDSGLFGSILRTFISTNGVEWSADTVCVFDGLQNVLEKITAWYGNRLSLEKAAQFQREDAKNDPNIPKGVFTASLSADEDRQLALEEKFTNASKSNALPKGIDLFVAEPIADRKSLFIGRACRISHPSEVPLVLSHLMADRRISRAAHPVINAWRCHVGPVLHQDNDDDGESAAGGRLAHLLQILEVDNVLVIVTRYFGGVHLGPDRFKHINQAARNALDLGGFLEEGVLTRKPGRSGRKH